jgi:hypothetical protein
MNRKMIMGKSFEEAMMKNLANQDLSEREKLNWIDEITIISNPISIRSSDLELRLFTYKLAETVKSTRQLSRTEIETQMFIKRIYSLEQINCIQDIFAIEFLEEEMGTFYEMLKYYNLNTNILRGNRVWRVILMENIDEYELRKEIEKLNICDEITKQNLIRDLANLKI